MKDGVTQKIVDYLDASTMLSTSFFQYAGSVLQFFPHAEGYVRATEVTRDGFTYYAYDYVYPVK